MAMIVATNMGSVNAIRILDRTSRDQAVSMERLTSQTRINGAADDAAGLAIVTGFDSQIKGTTQAMRNASDGMNLAKTMDGAMDSVVENLQRMRELALGSLTGTYNDTNRSQMNTEFAQRAAEIKRIGQTTQFNEKNLFNGSLTAVSIHVGWQVGAKNQIKMSLMNISKMGADLAALTISTAGGASTVIVSIDKRLESISTFRAKWGAVQNRLDSTIANLGNVNENIIASRMTINDTDNAIESANLAKYQVMQQAGMSMLSQSNQSAQNVLTLLR